MLRKLIVTWVLLSSIIAVSFNVIGDYDPVELATSMFDAGQRDQALDTIEFSIEQKHGDQEKLQQLQKEYEYSSLERSKDLFYHGAIKGDVFNTWSGIGCIAADCLVLGDVRDLTIEGYHWVSGEDVDKVVVALSGLGVASTAAEVTGAGAVLDAGVSLLKTTAKYVKRTLKVVPESILKTVMFTKKLSVDAYKNLWSIYKNTGFSIQGFSSVLSQVKNIDYLPHLAKMSSALKKGTTAFVSAFGENGVKFYDRFGGVVLKGFERNPRAMLGASKIHALLGGTKSIHKNGFVTVALVVICGLGMLLALFPVWVPLILIVMSLVYLIKVNPIIRRSKAI